MGLFDRCLPLLLTPMSCCINGDHPGNVRKYIDSFSSYIEEHNLLCDVKRLKV